jgi:hypothetical protein
MRNASALYRFYLYLTKGIRNKRESNAYYKGYAKGSEEGWEEGFKFCARQFSPEAK